MLNTLALLLGYFALARALLSVAYLVYDKAKNAYDIRKVHKKLRKEWSGTWNALDEGEND